MHFKFSRALSVGRMQKWTPIFLEPLFQAERLKYKLESIFDSYNAKLEILQDEFKKSANTSQDFDEDFIEKESRICFQCNLEIQAVIRDAEREPNMRIVDLPKTKPMCPHKANLPTLSLKLLLIEKHLL